jgi:Tol biopolymer transport system component
LGIGGQGRADIAIVDADGRGLQKLTDGRGENYSPAWSSDGRVFFTAKLSECETIWSVKTFKPQLITQPATGDRRAAAVLDTDFDG